MVAAVNDRRGPLALAVSGEAESWLPAVEAIVGPQWLVTYRITKDSQLLEVVREGLADAAVLDDEISWPLSSLQVLRIIHRLKPSLPVVILARQPDRRWLEVALRLEAFSVVTKPLALEEMLRQIQRIMRRLDQRWREGGNW
jgi:DNA-binding NtrC family response regulator